MWGGAGQALGGTREGAKFVATRTTVLEGVTDARRILNPAVQWQGQLGGGNRRLGAEVDSAAVRRRRGRRRAAAARASAGPAD